MSENQPQTSVTEEMAKRFILEREQQTQQQANQIEEPMPVVQPTEQQPTPIQPKPTSLGKANIVTQREERRAEMLELRDTHSWKPIPTNYLPSKGMFYPENTQISIRAALVQEIRNYSTIDDTDMVSIDDKLNMIIEKCVRIVFEGQRVSFKELLELDRFYLVYAIRELTFKDGENKLTTVIPCTECENTDTITIKKDDFAIFAAPEKLMRFYDNEERAFVLTLRETGEKIPLYMPTLGVTTFIKQYVTKRIQSGKNYDKAFLKISPFLWSDWRGLTDAVYDKMNESTFSWDLKKMSIIIGVIEMLSEGWKPELKHQCSSCGTEVTAPLSFQGGLKKLFLYTYDDTGDFLDELI